VRPVRLRMHGFAAFREPTEVDFTGAEYFALVGPTGSGKSTVIDAMTFALYGSVPRWDNKNVVALALSPTANRGTVQLVFDVGGHRYVAVRDLRRTASGSVTVREARLERLLGPQDADDVETEVLAHGAAAVSKAVEDLLGLPFEQFCVCVVLPQGDFARFLHAKPADRQKTLTGILGLGMYEQMAREAGAEAKEQGQHAEWLAERLADYADATQEAAAEAAARETALTELVARVAAAFPELAEHDARVLDADRSSQRLRAECDSLAGLRVPDGLDELGPRAERVELGRAQARLRLAEAETADTEARKRVATAPDPEPLRQLRRDHAELTRLRVELPALQQAWERATRRTERAREAASTAEGELVAARVERDAAEAAQASLRAEDERLAAERALLDRPRVPDGVAELDERRARAAAALASARGELAAAEMADSAARHAVAVGPDRSRLAQARRDHAELAEAEQARRDASERGKLAEARLRTAEDALALAERELTEAADAKAAAERSDLVGALRPGLVLHEPCPVCDQRVERLPTAAAAADLSCAERAVRAAVGERDRARAEHRDAVGAERRAATQLETLSARIAALRARLTETEGSIEQVDALLAHADGLVSAARAAETRAGEARRNRDAAETADSAEALGLAAGAAELRAARDPLVALGAPSVETGHGCHPAGLAAGWRGLTEWAREAVARRDEQLTGLRAEFASARQAHTEAERAYAEAEERLRALRGEETEAVRAEQDCLGALGAARRRVDELGDVLDGAPDDDELAHRLVERELLVVAVRSADEELRTARLSLVEANDAADRLARHVERGWRELRAARDPLVVLGAPAQDGPAGGGADLVAAWGALAGWAGTAARRWAQRLAEAEAELATSTERREWAHRELAEDLRANDVPVPADQPLPRVAAPAASAALERARAASERIAERRATAAKLATDRAGAAQAEQVARMLATLLRSDAFPRWLAASALDALVADASRSLAELSGGQFELTHADGEFLVVDHADADSRRPVKTLSGGETFQASLALALALSEQLSTMASAGAARLDSIFLDEGFGTLDEANLEIVASTLENLAAHRDRMVGVITHVPALAERVPVRFAVSRDQRTASISREETG
jgi:exonuclease SbcC